MTELFEEGRATDGRSRRRYRRTKLLVAVALTGAMVLGAALLAGCDPQPRATETVPLRFVQFYDPECPYCQEMEPTVEKMRKEYGSRLEEFRIVDIHTDEGERMVEEFGVFITPTFVLLDGEDEELDRMIGATNEESMRKFIERGIADVTGEGGGPRETIEGEGTNID